MLEICWIWSYLSEQCVCVRYQKMARENGVTKCSWWPSLMDRTSGNFTFFYERDFFSFSHTHFFCLIWILKWLCIICDNEIKQRFHFGFFKKINKSLSVCPSTEVLRILTTKSWSEMLQESGLESFGRWKFEIFIRDWDKIILYFMEIQILWPNMLVRRELWIRIVLCKWSLHGRI